MTIEAFSEAIVERGGTLLGPPEKYSTLNAWGFGGSYGMRVFFTYRGRKGEFRKGRVGTRHQGTFPFHNVRFERQHMMETKDFLKLLDSGAIVGENTP